MKKFSFKNAAFIKTAILPKDYPQLLTPQNEEMLEIAVAGRSNVGKSSLLNHLFQRKSLVKTSSVPGKTQAINFFTVDEALSVVDLPGYGFAKVPKKIQSTWGKMTQSYMDERKPLRVMLLLLDIRRIPNDEDRQLVEWIAHHEKALLIVLTKVDKVKPNEKRRQTQKILDALPLENPHYVHYSTTKNVGRKELIYLINAALQDEVESEEEENG